MASSRAVHHIMASFHELITTIRTKSSTNLIICGIIPRPCDLDTDPKESRMKDANRELEKLC